MKITKLVILVVITLSLVQIFISHSLSTTGEKIKLQELKIDELNRKNQVLFQEIGDLGSLAKISSQASELGFVRTSQVVHLPLQVPVALK